MSASFERLCLAAGLEALGEMMEVDARTACGPRHGRGKDRTAHRCRGKTKGKIGFHGGKVEIARPRLRSFDGKEQALPSWKGAMTEDWLGKWAMNQMLINVSTRKFERSMRLPEGDVPAPNGSGLSKSAASRRFVALSAARLKEWMGSDLSDLGLLVIQIDGIHMDEDMTLVAAIGVDVNGDKHPLGLVEGATENAATVQALIDNLVERGLNPTVPRLFIIDGSKALSQGDPGDVWARRGHSALSDTQGPQHHGSLAEIDARASEARPAAGLGDGRRRQGRKAPSQSRPTPRTRLGGCCRLDPGRARRDAHRNKARTAAGHCGVRSPARTSSRMSWARLRRVSRNVNDWRSPSMALRWAGAAMQEAAKGFRRLKAYKQLFHFSRQRSAFTRQKPLHRTGILPKPRRLRRFSISDARFALFNIKRDIALKRTGKG